MKKNFILHIIFVLVAILFISCVKKTLFENDNGNEPNTGELTIIIDWENMAQDEIIDNAIIKIADTLITVKEGEQPEKINLAPDNYDIYIYNLVENIIIDSIIATIDKDNNDNIISDINSFYSDINNITISENETGEATLKPEKNMRELIIKLDISNLLTDSLTLSLDTISGTINNLASSFNIKTREENNPGKSDLDFEDYSAAINIFGIIGSDQILSFEATVNIINIPGYRIKYEKNIGYMLNDFNDNKATTKEITIVINYGDFEILSR